jgi:hypothetical protein
MKAKGMLLVAGIAGLLVAAPIGAAEASQSAQNQSAVALVQSLGVTWNRHDLEATLGHFAADATIQGGTVCCAARGVEEIRPFLHGRFAEDHQIAWGTPKVEGNKLAFVSRAFARDGLHDQVDLRGGGQAGDREAAGVRVEVQDGKVKSLVLELSEAARGRAQAAREKSDAGR